MSQPHVLASSLVLKAFPSASPVDFTVLPGSHWLIVGEAGSGKTSLAKSLLGIISVARGNIALFGQSLDRLAPSKLLACRRRTATIFSGDGLMPAWTGYDNLALPLHLAGANGGNTIERRVRDWADSYQIPAVWLDSISGTLSRDARLTLALARALIKGPDMLILDGVPIDNALAYRRSSGLAMLGDFVRTSGSLVVLVREAYANRYSEAALPLRFQRAHIEAGQLQFDSDFQAGEGVSKSSTLAPRPPSQV